MYKRSLKIPVKGLFEIFSVDFAGPLPHVVSTDGMVYEIGAVEHLTGWSIICDTPNAMS